MEPPATRAVASPRASPGRPPRPWISEWAGQPLRLALRLVLVVAAGCAVAAVAVVQYANPDLAVPMAAFAGIGLADVAIGVLAWSRRPHNRTGLLLCWLGFVILVAVLGNSDVPLLHWAGFTAGQVPIAAILHVLLAFPSGRLGRTGPRLLAAAGYGATFGLDLVRFWQIEAHHLTPGGEETPLYHAARLAQRSLGAAVLFAASVHLLVRLRGNRSRQRSAAERRAIAGVYVWGIGMLWFFPLSADALAPLLHWSPVTLFGAQITPMLVMPVVFAAALLRGGFARTGRVEELGAALATAQHGYPSLREAVAATLGDPSVAIVLPVPTAAPPAGRGRVLVHGSAGPEPFAAIDYDSTLIADPHPVDAAAEVISLALHRDQLLTELIASRQQVMDSRARIIEATDRERRRVVTDLHDVLQSRLVLTAMHAGALANRTTPGPPGVDDQQAAETIRRELDDALTELRRLIRGVMPATLTDLGLAAAVEELLDRIPLAATLTLDDGGQAAPLPEPVATTAYLVIAEAVTNAVRHSGATTLAVAVVREPHRVLVRIDDDGCGGVTPPTGTGFDVAEGSDRRRRPRTGLGLRSITDRAEALGGRLTIDSPPGQGTHLSVALPLPAADPGSP